MRPHRLGHGSGVARFDVARPSAGNPGKDDVTVRGLPLPGYPGLRFGLPAVGFLRRRWPGERQDVVHVVTEGPLGWSAVRCARSLGIPVTSGFHTNFDHYSVHYGLGWLRPLIAAYLRGLHRKAGATLVPTSALAAELAGAGIPGVRVVGRGVDTDLFDPARRCPALRLRWGAAESDLVCLYVGRLAAEKNLVLVERSFAEIRRSHPSARLVWVGDGPSREALASRQLPQHFAGWRRDAELATHYASADLFLFPSLTETYGNVVAEAMASGLGVVAYRSAGAAELIAYFSGFGSKKRIVLFGTLLKEFSDEQIIAVLAHEIGHYKKKHVLRSLLFSVILTGLTFFLFSLVVDSPLLSKAMGAETPSFHLGLIVFGILYSPLSLIIGLITNYISRKNEFEADRFVRDNYKSMALSEALKKLSVKNLSNMLPHPAYVFFHYSHPPLLGRLAKLE